MTELLEFLQDEVLLLLREHSSGLSELCEFGLYEFRLVGSSEERKSTTEAEQASEKNKRTWLALGAVEEGRKRGEGGNVGEFPFSTYSGRMREDLKLESGM